MTILKSQREITELKNQLLERYPVLREPGLYNPAKHGRAVLTQGQILALFDGEHDEAYLISVAIYITAKRLSDIFKDERFSNRELPIILNQHFTLAELILLHHSQRLEGLYDRNINDIEEKRGKYLGQLAEAEDTNEVCWAEYAYWLLGRNNKKKAEGDFEASAEYLNKAEEFFRRAHEAGYAEATEALATLLYVDRSVDGAPYVSEAMALWEQAAKVGNILAIQNYHAVIEADDSLSDEERQSALKVIWQGVSYIKHSQRPPQVKEIATLLKNSGVAGTVSAKKELVLT